MGRQYKIAGKKYPSVTTILGMIAKPQLVGWAARLAAETGDPKAGEKERNESAKRGTAIHDYIEGWFLKKSVRANPEFAGYISAFHAWEAEALFTLRSTEEQVYSVQHGYAGTLDLSGTLGANLAVLDFKTVNSPDKIVKYKPYAEHRLQLEAYRRAKHEMDDVWFPAVSVVRLAPDGTYDATVWADQEEADGAWETFLAVKRLYEWNKRYRRKGS